MPCDHECVWEPDKRILLSESFCRLNRKEYECHDILLYGYRIRRNNKRELLKINWKS